VIEAVKLADDQSGDIVVRLCESFGGRAEAVLRPGFPAVRAEAVDLLERPAEDISTQPRERSLSEADGALDIPERAAVDSSADLRERSLDGTRGALDVADDGSIRLSLPPFQILTVRLGVSA
jgi:hypothetical protein